MSLYVDDFVSRDDSDDSVVEMHQNLKSSLKNRGLNVQKWVSNSKVLQKRIEQSESQSPGSSFKHWEENQSYSSSLFNRAKNPTTINLKVLGVGWDSENDLFWI